MACNSITGPDLKIQAIHEERGASGGMSAQDSHRQMTVETE